ncbi:hypothetical protein N9O48_01870 [Gammaproteobacteria bacterium]|nr:hypothetical protein [Gammaproteobacteria bacterium]
MKKLANIIIKFSLPAIILILSPALVADERASSDKCYLYVNGYINDKNQVKEFLADKNFSLDKYSVWRRNDGQYYFTFGKMKKKLFEDLKQSGQTEGFGCTRGKGFKKRFNINEELKLVSGTKKLIESVDDFYKATSYGNTDTNYGNTDTNIVQQSKENSSNSSSSAIDPNLLKLKKQIDSVTNEIRKASKMSSGFQQMIPGVSKSFSLDFIALKNKKFSGLIQDLDGTMSIKDSVQPQALLIYDSKKYESVYDLIRAQEGSVHTRSRYDTTRSEELDIISIQDLLESLFSIGIYQESFDELPSSLLKHLQSVVAQDSFYADSNMKYFQSSKPDEIYWDWVPGSSRSCFAKLWDTGQGRYFYNSIDLTNYAFVIAPKSCMYNYNFNEATHTLRNFPGFEPITINSNLASINYFEFILNTWNRLYVEKMNQILELASSDNGLTSGYISLNVSDGKKLCVLEDGNEVEVISAGSIIIDENNFESLVSNKLNYSNNNDIYRAVQTGSCNHVILDLESFLKISSQEKNLETNFFTLNLKTINSFFTKNEALEIYKNAYSGLSKDEIDEHELVTSYKFKASDASLFVTLKEAFIQSNISYTKDNFKIFANFTNDIYGNSYFSSIGSILKNYQDLISIGIDLKDIDQSASISRAITSDNRIKYSSDQFLQKYTTIATDLDLNLQQMELLFSNFSQIIDGGLVKNFNIDELYIYYKAQLKIAESKNETYADHISKVMASEKIKREEQQRLDAEAAAVEREKRKKEREAYAKDYPYKIILECHLGGSKTTLYACFGGSDSAETDVDITSGNTGYSYGYYDLASAGYNFLSEDVKSSFNITAQLSPGSPFSLKLFVKSNATNKTLLSDSCSSAYCVVSASNFRIN